MHEHWGWCAQPCVALKVDIGKENSFDPDGSAVLLSVYPQKTQAGALFCSRYKKEKKLRTVKLYKTFTGFMIHTD